MLPWLFLFHSKSLKSFSWIRNTDLSELALRVTPLHHLTPLVAYRLRNEEIHSTIILTAFFFIIIISL